MPKTKPNVLLILADDMGYGDLSCFNGGLSHTPRLDALADVHLAQDHAASPVCRPKRANLMTGRTRSVAMRDGTGSCCVTGTRSGAADAMRFGNVV